MTTELEFQPIILIGAARSGTKLVRDLIGAHPEINRVPYDINYVWRLGNQKMTHDELSIEALTPTIRHRIQQYLARQAASSPFLVEKTVSNCLRVPYVNAVLPTARYIHLIRDGRDVVESAYRQWQAPTNWRYTFQKARSFPIWEAPGYAMNYARQAISKQFSRSRGRKGTWGPRYEGIDKDLANLDLLEVCAIQWAHSVQKAVEGLSKLPPERVLLVRYEDFVADPLTHLHKIAQFLAVSAGPYQVQQDLTEKVSKNNIGKGLQNLDRDMHEVVLQHITKTLISLGYL